MSSSIFLRAQTLICAAGAMMLVALPAFAAGPDVRLVEAARQQDKAVARALVKAGGNVNTPEADGATALLWTAHWNDLELADLLLGARADATAADDHGVTPLGLACENASAAM